MLHLALTLVLLAPLEPAAAGPAPPQDEVELSAAEQDRLAKALADLDKNIKTRIEPGIISAMLRNREVVHPEVIARVGPLLSNRKLGIRRTAIEVLRGMKHPDALAALTEFCEKDKRLLKDADLLARTFRAIAWHGERESIPLLADPELERSKFTDDPEVVRARLRGLGMIRSRFSIDALLGLAEGQPGWKPSDHVADLRLSLRALTGHDHGLDMAAWKTWWEEAREEFEVPIEEPELPFDARIDWFEYWGIPTTGDPGLNHPRRGLSADDRRKREAERKREKAERERAKSEAEKD